MQDWRQILADSFRDGERLLSYLDIPSDKALQADHPALAFPLLVPRPFADQMARGDLNDPLLRQVLPIASETHAADLPGYSADPLGERQTNIRPGIIHKYQGRVLMLAATGCAVNCRYCFRRHFDYADNRLNREERKSALDYIRADTSISEVILSGGDPLMLQDAAFADLITAIDEIDHVRRIRIHTRLPVVIPQRLTPELQTVLSHTRTDNAMVLHVNHPNELTALHAERLRELRSSGVTLLNQSVLLKGVNDDIVILAELSEKLFTMGVLPYYLHLPDKVEGTQHYFVDDKDATALYLGIREQLPGYLVPQLVREVPGDPYKRPHPVLA